MPHNNKCIYFRVEYDTGYVLDEIVKIEPNETEEGLALIESLKAKGLRVNRLSKTDAERQVKRNAKRFLHTSGLRRGCLRILNMRQF
jgi:hypothetical protein